MKTFKYICLLFSILIITTESSLRNSSQQIINQRNFRILQECSYKCDKCGDSPTICLSCSDGSRNLSNNCECSDGLEEQGDNNPVCKKNSMVLTIVITALCTATVVILIFGIVKCILIKLKSSKNEDSEKPVENQQEAHEISKDNTERENDKEKTDKSDLNLTNNQQQETQVHMISVSHNNLQTSNIQLVKKESFHSKDLEPQTSKQEEEGVIDLEDLSSNNQQLDSNKFVNDMVNDVYPAQNNNSLDDIQQNSVTDNQNEEKKRRKRKQQQLGNPAVPDTFLTNSQLPSELQQTAQQTPIVQQQLDVIDKKQEEKATVYEPGQLQDQEQAQNNTNQQYDNVEQFLQAELGDNSDTVVNNSNIQQRRNKKQIVQQQQEEEINQQQQDQQLQQENIDNKKENNDIDDLINELEIDDNKNMDLTSKPEGKDDVQDLIDQIDA